EFELAGESSTDGQPDLRSRAPIGDLGTEIRGISMGCALDESAPPTTFEVGLDTRAAANDEAIIATLQKPFIDEIKPSLRTTIKAVGVFEQGIAMFQHSEQKSHRIMGRRTLAG